MTHAHPIVQEAIRAPNKDVTAVEIDVDLTCRSRVSLELICDSDYSKMVPTSFEAPCRATTDTQAVAHVMLRCCKYEHKAGVNPGH